MGDVLGVLFMVWCISGAVWFVMFLTGLRVFTCWLAFVDCVWCLLIWARGECWLGYLFVVFGLSCDLLI